QKNAPDQQPGAKGFQCKRIQCMNYIGRALNRRNSDFDSFNYSPGARSTATIIKYPRAARDRTSALPNAEQKNQSVSGIPPTKWADYKNFLSNPPYESRPVFDRTESRRLSSAT